jgi:hypothetical protein
LRTPPPCMYGIPCRGLYVCILTYILSPPFGGNTLHIRTIVSYRSVVVLGVIISRGYFGFQSRSRDSCFFLYNCAQGPYLFTVLRILADITNSWVAGIRVFISLNFSHYGSYVIAAVLVEFHHLSQHI